MRGDDVNEGEVGHAFTLYGVVFLGLTLVMGRLL